MEEPLRIPEHGSNHAILIELADVVHARFRKLAVQNKGEGCHGNLSVSETDLGPVCLNDTARGKGVHNSLATIHDAFCLGKLLGKALSDALAAQSACAEIGNDKVFDDLHLKRLILQKTVEADIPKFLGIRESLGKGAQRAVRIAFREHPARDVIGVSLPGLFCAEMELGAEKGTYLIQRLTVGEAGQNLDSLLEHRFAKHLCAVPSDDLFTARLSDC